MPADSTLELSFYPGCSLATTARESLESLYEAFGHLGIKLVELKDWSCCGSSSAHSLDSELALELAARNLTLAPAGRPLMIACPSCFKNLRHAQKALLADPAKRDALERRWGRVMPDDLRITNLLEIIHFIEVLGKMDPARGIQGGRGLAGLKVAPYYGCMLAEPAPMRRSWDCHGLLEKTLTSMGAEVLGWGHKERCCGTFLTASRPDIAAPLINRIMQGALAVGADCVVTACAMCQLNLEIRCTLDEKIPILHFSEALCLGLGAKFNQGWFSRHLVDPAPLLRKVGTFQAGS